MANDQLAELLKKQISLSEWFERINHPDVEKLRQEDNTKRDRLDVLHTYIGLPYDKPTRFLARQIADQSKPFLEFFFEHGDELCAMRLLPQKPELPKLRTRGQTVRSAVSDWFVQQHIDPDAYLVEFMQHPERHDWSTIFVVNGNGIFGEVIAESHQFLTQGFYTDIKPIMFAFDFHSWTLTPSHADAEIYLTSLIKYLWVENSDVQQKLAKEIGATFTRGYLNGYFESVHSEFGTTYIDYSPRLGALYQDFVPRIGSGSMMCGIVGSSGVARGRVRIVTDPEGVSLEPGEILVCDMTSPAYVGLMQQACAIVTDRGGMLCHAAIIARELKKPCIVGTGNAKEVLRDGDMVEVDAGRGIVRLLSPAKTRQ